MSKLTTDEACFVMALMTEVAPVHVGQFNFSPPFIQVPSALISSWSGDCLGIEEELTEEGMGDVTVEAEDGDIEDDAFIKVVVEEEEEVWLSEEAGSVEETKGSNPSRISGWSTSRSWIIVNLSAGLYDPTTSNILPVRTNI
jgi:hypothetical protein